MKKKIKEILDNFDDELVTFRPDDYHYRYIRNKFMNQLIKLLEEEIDEAVKKQILRMR